MKSDEKNNYQLKSDFIKNLIEENKNMVREDDIKSLTSVNISKIIDYVSKGVSDKELNDICEDINSGKLKMGIDVSSINLIDNGKENESIKKVLQAVRVPIDIDVNGLNELSSEKFEMLKDTIGIEKIGKVYVNSGCDEAARRGYTAGVYTKIINNAEKMVSNALKKLPKDASETDRFMAIYNAVIKNTVYDYTALKDNAGDRALTSRNLEGYFVDGASICAGTADVLKQLCEMNGIKAEYVQGRAQSKKMNSSCYHAWVRVQIDGQWYNADPTWDANKVGKPYEFCLKSDVDFKGHNIDKSYNPNYSRNNSKAVRKSAVEHHDCNYSKSGLDRYYSADIDRYLGRSYGEITEEELNEARLSSLDTYMPMGGSVINSNSIIQTIINVLIKITSFPVNKIKSTFSKNKHKIKASDISSLTSESSARDALSKNSNLSEYIVGEETSSAYLKEKKTEKGKDGQYKEENIR